MCVIDGSLCDDVQVPEESHLFHRRNRKAGRETDHVFKAEPLGDIEVVTSIS